MKIFSDMPCADGGYLLSDESKLMIKEMNEFMHGLTMEDLSILVGKRFKFPIYPEADYMKLDISYLDMSQRAFNAIKRSNINTVEELATVIESESDLRNFRNLGAKTAKEIMLSLLFYQYSHISNDSKDKYMNKLLEMNGIYINKKVA